ncbi:MAG: ATPase, partial [Herbaspirillum sp.]
NKFWGNLREKSRVHIEHPDLPEVLKLAAGELTATVWKVAQTAANESLASYRSEVQAAVSEAKAVQVSAEHERDTAYQAQGRTQQILEQATIRLGALERQLAAADATNSVLEAQLQQAKAENSTHQQRLEDARREFTAELNKLRVAAELADERFRAAEKRALLEIDRERSAASKIHKELDAARAIASQTAERHRSELTSLQQQLGDLRQQTGMLEGNLQAVTESRDATVNELKTVHRQLAEMSIVLSTARADTDTWRQKAEQAQTLANKLRKTVKPTRSPRNS